MMVYVVDVSCVLGIGVVFLNVKLGICWISWVIEGDDEGYEVLIVEFICC